MALASTIFSTTGVHGLDYEAVIIAPEVIVRQENILTAKSWIN